MSRNSLWRGNSHLTVAVRLVRSIIRAWQPCGMLRRTWRCRDIRLVVDTIPTLAWSARPDGSAEFHNQRWLDYTAYLQSMLGLGWEGCDSSSDSSCSFSFRRKPFSGSPRQFLLNFSFDFSDFEVFKTHSPFSIACILKEFVAGRLRHVRALRSETAVKVNDCPV